MNKYSGGNWRPNSDRIPRRAWLYVAGVLVLAFALCVIGPTLDRHDHQAEMAAQR